MAWFADIRDIPEIAAGLSELVKILQKGDLITFFKKLKTKIIAYFRFTCWFFVSLWVVWLFHCAKPDSGVGTCIMAEDSGLQNTATINMKDFFGAGPSPSDNNYENGGQRTNWYDTGFITNGKKLIIYVSGEYFPWGKKQTERTTGYHLGMIRNEEGEFETTLQIKDDYVECDFNTNHLYYNDDTEKMRLSYANYLTQYTGQNRNNRTGGSAYTLSQFGIQSDCIVGNNCFGNQDIVSTDNITMQDYPTGCVLKNGAGIYMRIGGENVKYAYHLKNSYVPLLEKKCKEGDNVGCEWKYKDKTTTGEVSVAQVPFGLPIQIYDQDKQDIKIFTDIKDNLTKNLVDITKYQWKEDQLTYKFTTLEKVKGVSGTCEENDLTDFTKYQTINDICYQSITKEMTNEEIISHGDNCQSTSEDVLHPDELCPPPKGKRIYVKPADTFYEDDEGSVSLMFVSGAENSVKKVSYSKNGFKLSWIQTILYTLLEPVWGEQVDTSPPDELIEMCTKTSGDTNICGDLKSINDGELLLCHKNKKKIFFSSFSHNWLVKTAKFATTGIILKMANASEYTTELYNLKYKDEKTKQCLLLTPKDINNKPNLANLNAKVHDGIPTWLIQIDNIQDGLFIQIRDAILRTGHFHMARILITVWFVFSFGLGVIGRYKSFNRQMLNIDWKRFLICMWATDYHNYELIDELLWPALFHGAETFSTFIFEAGADVVGLSLNPDNPYEFFDNIISMVTSKELILKFMALATHLDSGVSILFFLYVPLTIIACVELFKAVIVPISMVCMTIFGVGQVMMLMPLYALASFFKSTAKTLQTSLGKLIKEFTHFALELGFFGLFIGIVYDRFLHAIEYKICWLDHWSFLFHIFEIKWENWVISDNHQSIKGFWSLIKIMAGCVGLSMFLQFAVQLATMCADKICPSGGLGLGLKKANEWGTQIMGVIGSVGNAIFEGLGKAQDATIGGNKGGSTTTNGGGAGNGNTGGKISRSSGIMPVGSMTIPTQTTSDGTPMPPNGAKTPTQTTSGGTPMPPNGAKTPTPNLSSGRSAIEEAKRLLNTPLGKNRIASKSANLLSSSFGAGLLNSGKPILKNSVKNDLLNKSDTETNKIKENNDKKVEQEVVRPAGLESSFGGLEGTPTGLESKPEGLQGEVEFIKNGIAGENNNKEEELKKQQEEKKKQQEEEQQKKIENAKKQQEQIEKIKEEERKKKIEEERIKQEAIKKQQEHEAEVERQKKALEEARIAEQKAREERAREEERIKKEIEAQRQREEAEKEQHRKTMMAAQKLEKQNTAKQKQSEYEKRTRTTSRLKKADDFWSRMSSGKSGHYMQRTTKTIWVKKK